MKIFPAMSQGGETHSKRDCARFDSVAGSPRTSDDCGFDRNASHSAGEYMCTCGYDHAPLAQPVEPPT